MARADPSHQLALADYWAMSQPERWQVHKRLGRHFEKDLLLNLGLAAHMVPAWCTPQGRRRIKVRLRSSQGSRTSRAASAGGSGLGLENLVQYHYQLAIGDEEVSEEEWRQRVEAKSPLVRFRGQWVDLDRAKMQEMLEFWQRHGGCESIHRDAPAPGILRTT